MSRISPTLEGFRAAFRRPSLTFGEILWRWSFGATTVALLLFGFFEYLATLPVTNGELFFLRTRHPFFVAQALAHILHGSLYRAVISLLVAALGTPHDIRTAGTILFMEDVNAKPYQVDRMLMQLKLAGKLNNVKGIVFGEMLDCVQTHDQPYTLQQVVLRIVGELGIPVAWGLRSGHVTRKNITLPIGVRASLSVKGSEVQLKILEAATAPA